MPLIGHQDILNYFAQGFEKNNLAHAYLFSGQSGLGKATVAREIVKTAYCPDRQNGRSCSVCAGCLSIEALSHPDVIFITPELNEKTGRLRQISIDVVREAGNRLKLTGDDYKFLVIDDAHSISEEGVNSLLKILEEPRGKSVIILIVPDRAFLPETIISRLRLIRFRPVSKTEMEKLIAGYTEKEKEKILFLAAGRPGRLLDFLSVKDRSLQKEAEDFFPTNLEDKFLLAKNFGEEVGKGEKFIESLISELHWRLARGGDRGKLKTISLFMKILSSALYSLRQTDANARLIFESTFLQIHCLIKNAGLHRYF